MKNINTQLLFMKALGIISVVSCHIGDNFFNIIGLPISKSTELFPEYSYHMPLFIFTSGYFYKTYHEKNNLLIFINKKFKLLKDYYKFNLLYMFLCFILISLGLLNRSITFSFYNFFIEPFLGGFQWYFNGPGWFVLFLFCLQVFYYIPLLIAQVKCMRGVPL